MLTESYPCSRRWRIRPACLPTSPSQCVRNRKRRPCYGHMTASRRAPSIAARFNPSCVTIVPRPKPRPSIDLHVTPLRQPRGNPCSSSYFRKSQGEIHGWPKIWPAPSRPQSPGLVRAVPAPPGRGITRMTAAPHLTHLRPPLLRKVKSSVAICWSASRYKWSSAIRPEPWPLLN